ncbi:hypothetical protein ASG90_03950 [Nocardioides sp. Soil797]|nr:hypothetical protein ASG90_03950 [Nocardioides sp. Soil797]
MFALAPAASTAAASAPLDVVDGNVYGWGWVSGTNSAPWTSTFPNDDAPFVDVAAEGESLGQKAILAVTASGDIVTQGDYNGVVALMPTSLASKHVIAVDLMRGEAATTMAAAVTDDGAITTWGTATQPPAEYQNPTAPTGVVDVQLGRGFGVALKDDGSLVAWGDAEFVASTPMASNVVKVISNVDRAIALTSDGEVLAWNDSSAATEPFVVDAPSSGIVDIGIGGSSSGANVGYAVTSEGEVITWGGGATGPRPVDMFPSDQVTDPVIALSETSGGFWGGVALTDQGEFVGWGGAENISTPQVNVEGHSVVSFSFAELSHFQIIFGPEDVAPPEPGVENRPRVVGDPVIGTSVTGTPATWNFEPTSRSSAWYAAPTADTPQEEWTQVGDADTLELTEALDGQFVVYRSTAVHENGETFVADSDPIGPVDTLTPALVESPKIQGVPLFSSQLIGLAAKFNFTPTTVSSGWYAADSADAAPEDWTLVSNVNPYKLAAPETGKYVVFRTTATDPEGGSWVEDSEPIGPVVKFASTTPPTITGNPVAGSTLTGTPGEFSFEPETVTYMWLIGGTQVVNVPPGDPVELPLTDEYVGKTIKLFEQGKVAGLTATGFSSETAAVIAPAVSTTEVSVSKASSTWGQAHTVTVQVAAGDAAPTGTVDIKVGSSTKTVELDDSGVAKLAVPTSLTVGKYAVTAAYSGNETVAASEGAATLSISKAKVSLSEKFAARIKKGSRAKGVVKAKVVGSALKVGGTVKIYKGKKVVGKGKLKGGKVKIKLKKLPKGKNKLVLKLPGTKNTKDAKKKFVIKVR